MSRFLSSRLTSLKAYAPGEQPQDKAYIKLNTNESPYPPSALTQKAVEGESAFLHLYPDPECRELTKLLAEKNGLLPEQVLCSNGSDDILSYIFQAFGDGESGFAFPDISYGFYQVYGDFYGVPCCRIPLREDFSLCSEDYFALGCGIILANPNAQTGLMLSMEEIAAIAKKNPEHVLVVDEAYVDFAGESAVCLLSCYENIIIVRTFSKSRSLAGGRLGYALAGQELILDLKQIKYSTNPYSVNRMSQAAGLAALHDEEYYLECCRKIIATREESKCELRALGMQFTDSQANFLLARHPDISGENLYQELKNRGILVRYFGEERIRDWVRISIGTAEQMSALFREIKAILKKEEAR